MHFPDLGDMALIDLRPAGNPGLHDVAIAVEGEFPGVLKRAYRETLTAGNGDVGFVYLKGDKELIARRLARRTNHFMPAGLLESQFAALQEPNADEPSVAVTIGSGTGGHRRSSRCDGHA